MTESDGMDKAFEGQLRVFVTAAAQVGERLARARQESLRRAQAMSEQEQRELHSRIEAERAVSRVELANVQRAEWWDRATPEQIGRAYQVARAWSQEEPEAARAEERVRAEVRQRYGVDVDVAGADPEVVRELVRAQLERSAGDEQHRRSAVEEAEAAQLMAQAGREERLAEQARAEAEAEAGAPEADERQRLVEVADEHQARSDALGEEGRTVYDSAARREATARELQDRGIDREVVATRMRADVSQAKPATEAVAAGGRAPKARKTRGRAPQVQRTVLDR